MGLPYQADLVADPVQRRNNDRLQVLLARYEKAVGGFFVYRGNAASYVSAAEVVFDTESHDYSGWYSTANGRFTPLIAGLYRFSWSVAVDTGTTLAADQYIKTYLAKGGTLTAGGQVGVQRGTSLLANSVGSAQLEANGSTDYFSIIVEHNKGAAAAVDPLIYSTFFCGEYIGGKP